MYISCNTAADFIRKPNDKLSCFHTTIWTGIKHAVALMSEPTNITLSEISVTTQSRVTYPDHWGPKGIQNVKPMPNANSVSWDWGSQRPTSPRRKQTTFSRQPPQSLLQLYKYSPPFWPQLYRPTIRKSPTKNFAQLTTRSSCSCYHVGEKVSQTKIE